MKIVVVASGSAGNACVIASGATRLLVDAGASVRAITRALEQAGIDGMPTAVVVTHAHEDHVGHAPRMSKKLGIPIHMSESTARSGALGALPTARVFGTRSPFSIGALTVSPMPLPHDAAQVALVVSDGACKAAIATDLGEVPSGLVEQLAGADVVLLESNHDERMLAEGPYPARLKRRIASSRGHLSNLQSHALLRALPDATHTVVLMHLSRTNNRPELALDVARDALAGRRVRLLAADQHEPVVVDASAPRPLGALGGTSRAGAAPERPPRQARRGEPIQLRLWPRL